MTELLAINDGTEYRKWLRGFYLGIGGKTCPKEANPFLIGEGTPGSMANCPLNIKGLAAPKSAQATRSI